MTKLYTVKQAAKILGFSTNTVYKYVNDGSLKASRASQNKGRFRITKSSLEAFLGSQIPAETTNLMATAQETASDAQPNRAEAEVKTTAPGASLSLQTSRVLLLMGLVLIIIESWTASNFSLTAQLLRLTTIAIFFVLAYQFVYPAKGWRKQD
jgi:excisionase family DNA binding protein